MDAGWQERNFGKITKGGMIIMSDFDIQREIGQLLEYAHHSTATREQYLSQATSLAYQIRDYSVQYQNLDLIRRTRESLEQRW